MSNNILFNCTHACRDFVHFNIVRLILDFWSPIRSRSWINWDTKGSWYSPFKGTVSQSYNESVFAWSNSFFWYPRIISTFFSNIRGIFKTISWTFVLSFTSCRCLEIMYKIPSGLNSLQWLALFVGLNLLFWSLSCVG